MAENLIIVNGRPQGYLTVTEFAKKCNVGAGCVRRWIKRGKLRNSIKVGKLNYIPDWEGRPNTKVGRPAVGDGRNLRIVMHVSDKERDIIEQIADSLGMNMTDSLRYLTERYYEEVLK